jgi:hypothetical protein
MKEKIELIYDSYLNKAKDLMEYKALITLPVFALKQHPEVLEKFKVGINYSMFSPVPIPTKEVDVNNFHSIFEDLEKNYLSTSCIEKLVSIYEGYLFDLMKEIYVEYPQKLSSKKQLTISTILEAINKEELIYIAIMRELNEIKYQSLDKWHSKLSELFAINQIDENLTKTMVEIKSTRDLLVHNDGIINEIYLQKTDEKARGEIGNQISCEGEYFKESWATVVKLMTNIKELIVEKYNE